ncbi:acyl-CoA dehydrogenase family protein [Actinacidiphila acididurans]|uniref:Acyl-CoA dehydrogenase family protein n=1 Tax=Actinacidiphila acididurans TaxID=2784346 RepID=A0ABS2TZJ5_9ACTN|nr:acyl-CoA dehydrogenase family protein [Actinacidiphila acididurans]MBM9508237.1 acyl-CoA dehydrogenase family protein [Actinacidiphila acididurans]
MVNFTAEHKAFRELVRNFAEKEIGPFADEWEAKGIFPAHELFPKLGRLGLLGVEYDEKYGGQGADHLFTVILHEELGRVGPGGVALGIGVQTDMATPSLHNFGTEELKQKYLVPAIKGEAVCSVAVTEPDVGSDVVALRTRAVRDGDDWVINGSKLYITNGAQADWICLLARTSDKPGYGSFSQIVVPTDAPGFEVHRKLDKLGMRSSDTAELTFTDVRVPVGNTIGEIGLGFYQQMSQFQNERLSLSYTAVGGMETALARTADYLKARQAFGKPLIDQQYIGFTLAELSGRLDMLRHYNYTAAEAYIRGEDVNRFATVAKLEAGRLAREIAATCLQFHGGLGYMEEMWTARYFRDSPMWSIGGGADEVMLYALSRLDGYHG